MSMGLVFVVKTFADAVFLASYGMQYVPHLYVAQACALIGVSFLYSWLVKRGAVAVDTIILIALAAVATAAPMLPEAATFAVVLALVTLSTLAQLAVWNAVSSVVTGRKSRTFLPRAGAAATAGAVVGGFASSGIVALLGVASLAWVSAGIAIATLLVRVAMHRKAREWRQAKPVVTRQAPEVNRAAPLRQLVVLLAASVLVESLLSGFIDFGFKREVTESFGGAKSIGVFFALYYGITNVALLVIQLFASSRLLATRSLRSALSFEPLALGGAALLWTAFPVLAMGALARGLEGVLKFSIARPAQEVAMSPLAESTRRRLKVFLRGVLAPGGAALTGALLIGLAPWFARYPMLLPGTCVVVAALFWALSRASAEDYLTAVGSHLGLRQMTRPEAMLDRATIAKLLELCGSEDAGAAAVARDLLGRLVETTVVLARHVGVGNAASRRVVYDLLTERPSKSCAGELRDAVAREPVTEGSLAAGLLALGAHEDTSQISRARGFVEADDTEVALKRAAALYLSRVGALDTERGQHLKMLSELLGSDGVNAAVACEAAIARGAVERHEIETAIATLEAGESPEQRTQALIAAACLGLDGGIDLVIRELTTRSNDADPIAVRLHGAGLARVTTRVLDASVGKIEQQRLINALRANQRPEVTELAIRVLADVPHLRDQAVRILLSRHGETDIPLPALERALIDEMEKFAIYLWARPGYASVVRESQTELRFRGGIVDTEAFFLDELERCTERSLGRLCALLAVLGNPPAVFDAERGLRAPTFKRRNQALDVLQEVVHVRHKARLLELLDRYLMPTRKVAEGARAAAIALDPWLARCANRDEDPTSKRLWALRSVPLFDAIDGDSLVTLVGHAEEVELAANTIVVREGEPGDALYIVMEGALRVYRGSETVAELGPGESFGELAIIDGEPRQATVRTHKRSRVLRLPRDTFEEALAAHPEIGLGLVLGLVKWLRQGRTVWSPRVSAV